MKIFSWNVNGIRAVHRKGLLLPFIEKHSPDILCLQETKAQKGQAEIDLSDYEEYWNSAEKKGYSGTAIFVKASLKDRVKKIILGLPEKITKKHKLGEDGYGDPNKEGRVLTIEFDKFFLVDVYTPNAKEDLSRLSLRHKHWDPAFLEFCKTLETEKPVIFCGDLNVAHTEQDLARPKENVGEHGFTDEEREGIDRIIEEGFIDTFRALHKEGDKYTWWSNWGTARARNVGWRIDYFFISKSIKSKLQGADIHSEVLGSDHCPVSIDMNL